MTHKLNSASKYCVDHVPLCMNNFISSVSTFTMDTGWLNQKICMHLHIAIVY